MAHDCMLPAFSSSGRAFSKDSSASSYRSMAICAAAICDSLTAALSLSPIAVLIS